MTNPARNIYQPTLFTLKSRHAQPNYSPQSRPLFPSFSLAIAKDYKQTDHQEGTLNSNANKSNTLLPKRAYGIQLQQQIEQKRLKTREERERRVKQEKIELMQQIEYSPFGKQGNGAPFRDTDGNIIAIRKKPFTTNLYDNSSLEIAKKIEFQSYNLDQQTVNEQHTYNNSNRRTNSIEYAATEQNRKQDNQQTKYNLKLELERQIEETKKKRNEEIARRIEEEKREELKVRNDLQQINEANKQFTQIKRKQEEEVTMENRKSALKRTPFIRKIKPNNTSFSIDDSSQQSEIQETGNSNLLGQIIQKPQINEYLQRSKEDMMAKLENRKKLDSILSSIEKSIHEKSNECSKFYQKAITKIDTTNSSAKPKKLEVAADNSMDKTLKGNSRLISIKQYSELSTISAVIDPGNKFDQLSNELTTNDTPKANNANHIEANESTQKNVKEVIVEFDKLLSNISSL